MDKTTQNTLYTAVQALSLDSNDGSARETAESSNAQGLFHNLLCLAFEDGCLAGGIESSTYCDARHNAKGEVAWTELCAARRYVNELFVKLGLAVAYERGNTRLLRPLAVAGGSRADIRRSAQEMLAPFVAWCTERRIDPNTGLVPRAPKPATPPPAAPVYTDATLATATARARESIQSSAESIYDASEAEVTEMRRACADLRANLVAADARSPGDACVAVALAGIDGEGNVRECIANALAVIPGDLGEPTKLTLRFAMDAARLALKGGSVEAKVAARSVLAKNIAAAVGRGEGGEWCTRALVAVNGESAHECILNALAEMDAEKCSKCSKHVRRGSLNGYGECNDCAGLRRQRSEALVASQPKVDIAKGDTIRIRGAYGAPRDTYTGVVLTAAFYEMQGCGWYIEFDHDAQSAGRGYGYWKQGSDGGTVEVIAKAAPPAVEPPPAVDACEVLNPAPPLRPNPLAPAPEIDKLAPYDRAMLATFRSAWFLLVLACDECNEASKRDENDESDTRSDQEYQDDCAPFNHRLDLAWTAYDAMLDVVMTHAADAAVGDDRWVKFHADAHSTLREDCYDPMADEVCAPGDLVAEFFPEFFPADAA